MSNWNIIKTKIEVFDHPDAERLQLGKVGTYQVVVQKGLYDGGEEVVFAPEKSVLTGELEKEYKNYLAGPDQNRVHAVRLRGELSCGIIIPPHLIVAQCGKTIDEIPDDELAETLGITKYVPEVPAEMEGLAVPIEHDLLSTNHDCEQFGVYAHNFVEGERVIGTEKLHGSQIVVYAEFNGSKLMHKWLSTKNYNKLGLHLIDEDNFYWKAANDINLWDLIHKLGDGFTSESTVVQVFGEGLPCQTGYNYGLTKPTMRIIDIRINGVSLPLDEVPWYFIEFWVSVLYDGPYTGIEDMKQYAKGMETLSGKQVTIREGMVLVPYIARRAADGTRLSAKLINPKYRETGEEFN